MRGALEPLAGVRALDVAPGERAFRVLFDPEQVDTERLLAELEAAGEGARLVE